MLNVVDRMYIAAQAKWNKFRKEERGDVNIVSIVVPCGYFQKSVKSSD